MPLTCVQRSALPLVLLSCTAGGCEYFDTITIPSFDNQSPWAVVSIWEDGEHIELHPGNLPSETVSNSFLFYSADSRSWITRFAVSSAVDGGGISELEMAYRVRFACKYGAPNWTTIQNWTRLYETQTGSPGDSAENGLYIIKGFRGADYKPQVDGQCEGDAYYVYFEWGTTAEDFHGNVAQMGLGAMVWVQYWQD